MNSSVIQPSSRDGSAHARMTSAKQVSTRTSYRLALCRIDRVTRRPVERQDAARIRRPPAQDVGQRRHLHREDAAAIRVDDRRRLEIAADGDEIPVQAVVWPTENAIGCSRPAAARCPVGHRRSTSS